LGYRNAISKGLIYDSNTPLATMTPYALEAFVAFNKATNSDAFIDVIDRIFRFFDQDIQAMEEDEEILATSYAPFRDRTVINASSYAMYSYALCLPHVRTSQDRVLAKVHKLYEYIRRRQRADGSWFYAPQSGSFIDCFHSCIVLKNVAKTSAIVQLRDSDSLIDAGYGYICRAFLDQKQFLFRRFSLKNKPGLIKFDLYDSAEVLNLALLLGDSEVSRHLLPSIIKHFCRGLDVYSQIDVIGALRNKNTLRWAVMPFLYAASQVL